METNNSNYHNITILISLKIMTGFDEDPSNYDKDLGKANFNPKNKYFSSYFEIEIYVSKKDFIKSCNN